MSTSRTFREGDWSVDTSRALNPIRLVYRGPEQEWPAWETVLVPLQIRPPTNRTLGMVVLRIDTNGRFAGPEWQITRINIVDSAPLRADTEARAEAASASGFAGHSGQRAQSTFSGIGRSAATAISESDVTGLVQDLSVRPTKGAGFGRATAAIINDAGNLESAVGNASNCVRVDGTSAPCGQVIVDKEVPSGSVDGANVKFTVLGTPTPPSSLHLFRNGLLQKEGYDYTLSGSTISFIPASTPFPGDTILASYRR